MNAVAEARWALILHGGAKDIAPNQEEANRAGCLAALRIGQAVLESGGTALDAVEAVIRQLEDDPTFNAGRGSVRNADGVVETDAAMMDGRTLDVGGIAALTGVRHPVSVARRMLREEPILLAGDGAHRFARETGVELCDPADLIVDGAAPPVARGNRGHDTVGCVALDRFGDLAAGTSTGGLDGCRPGRVGDSPLPGCGFYADNAVGGTAFSGDGESIARAMMAARTMLAMEEAGPQAALNHAIGWFARVGGDGGGIALDRLGRVGWSHNSGGFAVAYAGSDLGGPHVQLHRNEIEETQ